MNTDLRIYISVNNFLKETGFYAFQITLNEPGTDIFEDKVIERLGLTEQQFINICKKYRVDASFMRVPVFGKHISFKHQVQVLFYYEKDAAKAIEDLIACSVMNKLNS